MVSDCESWISGAGEFENGLLIRVDENERIHHKLLGNLESHSSVHIYRNAFPSLTMKAKLHVFQIFAKAAGNANVHYAWFGASKDHINTILSHGFLPSMINHGSYGHGIYLSPHHFPLASVKSAENGHLMLCRVILGRTEVVPYGSSQWHPSSQHFDSGVDDLVSPTKYIVWSTHMNTHILPLYVITFTAVAQTNAAFPHRKPTSPWISFPALLSALAKHLPPQIMKLIAKYHKDHRDTKISRHEMVQNMRKLAGDELLAAIIKAHRHRTNGKEQRDTLKKCACRNFQLTPAM